MSTRRLAPAALALVISLMVCDVAQATWLGRTLGRGADAVQVLVTEGKARRGWVIFDPIPTEGGDLEVLGISVLSNDPSTPAFLVRFQATDADDVMEEIALGNMITVRKSQMVLEAGRLPIYRVEPRSQRGWRSERVKRASPFFSQWAYLVAGRALSGYPEDFERFFRRRPDQRALLERDAALVCEQVFGGPFAPTAPAADEPDLQAPFTDRADGFASGPFVVPSAKLHESHRARLDRAASMLDSLLTMERHDHHGEGHVHVADVEAKARRVLELIEEVLDDGG